MLLALTYCGSLGEIGGLMILSGPRPTRSSVRNAAARDLWPTGPTLKLVSHPSAGMQNKPQQLPCAGAWSDESPSNVLA